MPSHRLALPALLVTLLAAAPSAAVAASPEAGGEGGKPYLDVRDGVRAETVARERTRDDAPAGRDRAARALVRAQGVHAALQLDPTTGTVRNLSDLAGALTGPAAGARTDLAMAYVRRHRIALGITDADLAGLDLDSSTTTADGVTHLRWRQYAGGVALFDNGLAVDIDRAGRILRVGGSPLHLPEPNTARPELSAGDALARLRTDVDDGTGERAAAPELVYFDVNGALRLAWHLRYDAGPTAHYDAVVDAVTGRVLRRANLVKFAVNVNVFEHYPGATAGGTQVARNIETYLFDPGTATTLSGPSARLWADTNGDDLAQSGELVNPNTATSTFNTSFATLVSGGCAASGPKCSWDHTVLTSWGTNRDQNAIQAFWFVNQFRDHLAASQINFTHATGGFECVSSSLCNTAADDRVQVNTNDGAAVNGGGPDIDHLNNANMSTPPDGTPPLMQMYLFYAGTAFGNPFASPFRDVNGGDSAEIVFHEYTHGLSNRLVVDGSGFGALNTPQAGAMGEAWSDWYAMDFLNRGDAAPQGMGAVFVPDTATPGEVDLGTYTDVVPHTIRSQALDCTVGASASACPASGTAGSGGYTYGDFGLICGCGPEVHADGEIWAQTLWDLRAALITQLGSVTAGANAAEQLVTGAMRLSPPEPSFLDMRNAILQQDTAMGGTFKTTIWTVFAARGMGYFAGSTSGSDTNPVENFDPPPADGGPTGTLAGTVTDAVTGKPVAGAVVSVGGPPSGSGASGFTATTGASGTYSLPGLPVGTYTKVVLVNSDGHDNGEQQNVAIADGATTTLNFAPRRDWAASAGGAGISTDTDATFASFGCGPASVLDQNQGLGWSAVNPTGPNPPTPDDTNHLVAGGSPSATIQLPRPVDITAFAADPGNTCGDGASATTRQFKLETSQDGTTFTTAVDGFANPFTGADAGRMNPLTPTAGASAVRFVRLTLLSPQDNCGACSGRDFIDFSELAVYGNAVPTGTLSVPATATTGQTVEFDASSFTDDGAIVSYAWDFNGDGGVDQTTTTPKTNVSYPVAGTFAPVVRATDDATPAGSSTASASIVVSAPATPPGGGGQVVKPKAPTLVLTGLKKANGASVRVTCGTACAGRMTMTISKALAARLRLKTQRLRRLVVNAFAGTSTVRLRIPRSVLRRLRTRGIRSIRPRISARVVDTSAQVATLRQSGRVTISRR